MSVCLCCLPMNFAQFLNIFFTEHLRTNRSSFNRVTKVNFNGLKHKMNTKVVYDYDHVVNNCDKVDWDGDEIGNVVKAVFGKLCCWKLWKQSPRGVP